MKPWILEHAYTIFLVSIGKLEILYKSLLKAQTFLGVWWNCIWCHARPCELQVSAVYVCASCCGGRTTIPGGGKLLGSWAQRAPNGQDQPLLWFKLKQRPLHNNLQIYIFLVKPEAQNTMAQWMLRTSYSHLLLRWESEAHTTCPMPAVGSCPTLIYFLIIYFKLQECQKPHWISSGTFPS